MAYFYPKVERRQHMSKCKTIAICNQKGGVDKTTTTVNLGVGLAMQGKKVLLVEPKMKPKIIQIEDNEQAINLLSEEILTG